MNHRALLVAFATFAFAGCTSVPRPPVPLVESVDVERFMGDWYVIASIPTFLERGAHNAVESYALNEDGSIATTFVFRKDSFDGKQKTYTPTGFVTDTESNAIWGMRFVWPIKADYRIVYLDEEYSQTVIARNKRDFVWVMARSPVISDSDYDRLVALIASIGYDTAKLQKVPQKW